MSKCIGCAKCCYSRYQKYKIPLDKSEINNFKNNYFIKDNIYWLKMKEFKEYVACIFLDTENFKCTIYDERPTACRVFQENSYECKEMIKDN